MLFDSPDLGVVGSFDSAMIIRCDACSLMLCQRLKLGSPILAAGR
jgi:hypothetical protein